MFVNNHLFAQDELEMHDIEIMVWVSQLELPQASLTYQVNLSQQKLHYCRWVIWSCHELRRERKTGKRVALKGKYVLNTQEILDEVEKAEKQTLQKRKAKGRETRTPTPKIEEET